MTIDCAALTIKSGNAIVLRGSHYAERTNGALAAIVREALAEAGLPQDAVVLLAGGSHEDLAELATRGRPDRPADPARRRRAEGGPEGRRDRAGDLRRCRQLPRLRPCGRRPRDGAADRAQREGAEAGGLQRGRDALVDSAVAEDFLPGALADLRDAGVELVGDERARAARWRGRGGRGRHRADWGTEFLDLKIAVGRRRLARGGDRARQPARHPPLGGDRHRAPRRPREQFTDGVDAAVVYTNASTRFTDGFEFGMGAEIGNSTQKLHARGPIGLRELTTYKYVVHGDGQVRG